MNSAVGPGARKPLPLPATSISLMAPSAALKVLVVDDNDDDRLALQGMLEKQGYVPCLAADGREAVAAFVREKPDAVLMNVDLPGMDGFQATEYIRELCGDSFVPVLFITGDTDENSLAECIQRGGNDFIPKPVHPGVLKAKIEAFTQLRRLYETVKAQRDELAQHQRWIEREYQIAEAVLARFIHSGSLDSPNIKYMLSPEAIFNGDILLAAHRPSGELHVLLGDFTGHGLSAAIGAIPMADIFFGMTEKGFGIPEIVAEANVKLRRVLPRGLFLAAAMLEWDGKNRRLSIWNGGLPEAMLYRNADRMLAARFPSKSFPLGVVESEQLDCSVESCEVADGDRVYLYTDGLVEARGPSGEMFSEAQLERCFGEGYEPAAMFERIMWELNRFRGGAPQNDDVTLFELTVDSTAVHAAAGSTVMAPRAPSVWSVDFEFGYDALRGFDPLPTMMQVLLDAQRLHQHKQRIYMVLAELFLNALEHGLLGLDSTIKSGPGGFGVYYTEKEKRLAELAQGRIKVRLSHAANSGSGGRLVIRVEDSGPGFDFHRKLAALTENEGVHGRGVMLIRSVCESLNYEGTGNIAEAVYAWNLDHKPD